jgi:hypothetical protein
LAYGNGFQVGYGDVVPITVLGKFVAGCAMVVSVLIMALPISVIGTHFSNQWMEYKDVEQFKETHTGAPYFEKLTKSFKEHYFLMDDLAKKYTPHPPPALAKPKCVVLRDAASRLSRSSPIHGPHAPLFDVGAAWRAHCEAHRRCASSTVALGIAPEIVLELLSESSSTPTVSHNTWQELSVLSANPKPLGYLVPFIFNIHSTHTGSGPLWKAGLKVARALLTSGGSERSLQGDGDRGPHPQAHHEAAGAVQEAARHAPHAGGQAARVLQNRGVLQYRFKQRRHPQRVAGLQPRAPCFAIIQQGGCVRRGGGHQAPRGDRERAAHQGDEEARRAPHPASHSFSCMYGHGSDWRKVLRRARVGMGAMTSVVQRKVYQYVDMMETLLTNDDVKLLMRTLMLNNQVRSP